MAALLVAAAVVAGLLILSGSGGGSGSGAARNDRGHGAASNSGAHTASQVEPAVTEAPPTIGASGLLSPGVGWAVNGLGFYMTWDAGQHWSDVHVPQITGDVIAGFLSADSPTPRTLVLGTGDSGSGYGTCADPANGFGRPIGHLSISTDAGHTWRTSPFPSCRVPTRISFINARDGFAVSESGKVPPPRQSSSTGPSMVDGAGNTSAASRSPDRSISPAPSQGGYSEEIRSTEPQTAGRPGNAQTSARNRQIQP